MPEKGFTVKPSKLLAIVHASDATAFSYPRPGKTVCVFSGASSTNWASIVIQITGSWGGHEPRTLHSGPWRAAELNYPTTQQESLAFVSTAAGAASTCFRN